MGTAEIKRRLVHAGGAIFPGLYLVGLVTWPQLRLIYLGGAVLAGLLELLRLATGLDWRLFHELTREYEQSNIAGYALYTASSAAVIVVFEPRIAIPAVLMLAIADPVSGYLGADELKRVKRPQVLAVTFAICAGIAITFVPLPVAIFGAVIATIADGVKPVIRGYVIDDNLTIPLGAALALWAGLYVRF